MGFPTITIYVCVCHTHIYPSVRDIRVPLLRGASRPHPPPAKSVVVRVGDLSLVLTFMVGVPINVRKRVTRKSLRTLDFAGGGMWSNFGFDQKVNGKIGLL
eukprot:NODE_1589_length_572_cov_752.665392_g1282_i0.p2 GENE.NODE_1589_length_572_cov_752.665392_g1282_i0~~NODE_1589_length_572_cov_752.665392_g1282_i0.p2  ORF type:complete len:111 (+),score=11.00 NODE_1589_length_572_cov_752.665392_g1282_i0:32-334(+)